MSDVTLSILIVCWRAREHIVPCLDSVYKYTTRTDFEVVLINNSDDDLESFIAERWPQVRILDNDANLGFAMGNNVAAAQAHGKYLLLLNPDTWLRDGAIDDLVDFAQAHPDGGIWGGVTELPDGRIDPGCRQHTPNLWNTMLEMLGLSRLCNYGPDRSQPFEAEVPVLIGAFLMADADVWRRIDGFDPWFVMYSDEADLATRVRAVDRKVYMSGKCRITHNVGGGKSRDVQRLISIARGRATYYRKHYGPIARRLLGAMTWTTFLRRWLAAAVKRSDERAAWGTLWRQPGAWWAGWPRPENNTRHDRGSTLVTTPAAHNAQKQAG